jgi:hypothetical protein
MMTILTRGWNVMRVIRLVLGLIILVQGIMARDAMYGFFGVFLTFLALVNVGCCGVGGCSVPSVSSRQNKNKEIDYEEVGTK